MGLTGNFDAYYVLVELIFGNLISAMFGVLLIILLIGAITRMNMLTVIAICSLFIAAYMTLWWGGIVIAVMFLITLAYVIFMAYRWSKEAQI